MYRPVEIITMSKDDLLQLLAQEHAIFRQEVSQTLKAALEAVQHGGYIPIEKYSEWSGRSKRLIKLDIKNHRITRFKKEGRKILIHIDEWNKSLRT